MEEQIREKLDSLRIHLQNDGGDLEIISIEDKIVKLKLQGACGSCPHATSTIKDGLERILKEDIDPDIIIERVM